MDVEDACDQDVTSDYADCIENETEFYELCNEQVNSETSREKVELLTSCQASSSTQPDIQDHGCIGNTDFAKSDVSRNEETQDNVSAMSSSSSPIASSTATESIMSNDGFSRSNDSARASSRPWFYNLFSGSSEGNDDSRLSERDTDESLTGSQSHTSHKDDDINDEDMVKLLPHDPWQLLKELRNREVHFAKHRVNRFQRQCIGSVNFVRKLELKQKLEKHEGCVNALNFNQSGSLLASGSDDLQVILWDWQRGRPQLMFESGHRSNVFQAKFVPYTGDAHLVTCARDGQVRLAELSVTGVCKSTKQLLQHRGSAHKLALQEDLPHQCYSCGEDGVVYAVDFRREEQPKLLVVKEENRKIPLYSIHYNPQKATEFCVGGRDPFVRVYDSRMVGEEDGNTGLMKKFCPELLVDSSNKANVTCAVYSHDGTEILATYNDEDIYLFDNNHSEGASYIHSYYGHRNNATVKGVNFYGQRSEFIISGSDCGNVFLWDKKSEKIVQYFHADDGGVVNVLEPHPTTAALATSGLDPDIKMWEPTSPELTNLKGLASVIKSNLKDREEETSSPMFDSQMLWFLLRQLRRRHPDAEGDGNSTTSDSDSDDDDDSDNSDDGPNVNIPWNQWFTMS